MSLQPETGKESYSAPKLHKRTRDQANLILVGHASFGPRGATDLLIALYPLPEVEGNENLREHFEEKDLADLESRTFRLVRRVLTAFQSTREDFRRFVRGKVESWPSRLRWGGMAISRPEED